MTLSFRNVDDALPHLAATVLEYGEEVGTRQGNRAQELLHEHVVLRDPQQREITLPHRRASLPAQIAETAWMLAGCNSISWLSHYLPRAPEFSDDGITWRGAYGPRLRAWPRRDGSDDVIDQLSYVVDLLRADPLSRRAVISIYDPAIDSAPGKDIPCNDWIQFISRNGCLDMHVATRSNDLVWGWSGVNAFEWSVLQEIVARMLGVMVGELHFSITSLHVYDRHWKRTREISTDIGQENQAVVPFTPTAPFTSVDDLDPLLARFFVVEQFIRTRPWLATSIRDQVAMFPEPMLRGWLYVLAYHWTGDKDYLVPLWGTRLAAAALLSAGSPKVATPWAQPPPPQPSSPFGDFLVKLHTEKNAVYGDSWQRRGEMLGILANIARKVDRLGDAGAGDTSADTAIDLLVYLVKYQTWLRHGPTEADDPDIVGERLRSANLIHHTGWRAISGKSANTAIASIRAEFDSLEQEVKADGGGRRVIVSSLIARTTPLARWLWQQEQEAPPEVRPSISPAQAKANSTRMWNPEEN